MTYASYSSTGNGNIYGRIFSENGTALSNEFAITQVTSNYNPSVASLTNSDVFVAWEGDQSDPYGNIYGRVYSSNGTSLTNEFGINQVTTSYQAYPSVASLTNGNVFVTWEGGQTGVGAIYARLFAADGTALSNEFSINQFTVTSLFQPSAVSLMDGNVFVAWWGEGIYGRVFYENGTACNNQFGISVSTNGPRSSDAASLKNGNVFIAWAGGQQTGNGLTGRIFSASGSPVTDEFVITVVATTDPISCSVACLESSDVFVAWEDDHTGNNVVYGRLFSENGVALSNQFDMDQYTDSTSSPSVAGLTNGNIFAAWRGSGLTEIYGRIIVTSGIPMSSSALTGSTAGDAISSVHKITPGLIHYPMKIMANGIARLWDITKSVGN